MILSTKLSLTLAVLGLIAALPATASTNITFGPAQNITGDTDIATTGTQFLAAYFGLASEPAIVTVNGTDFADTPLGGSGNLTITNLTNQYSSYAGAVPVTATLSANYQRLLNDAIYQDGSGVTSTVTVSGLTAGNNYLAQFLLNDSRAVTGLRNETLAGTTTLRSDTTALDGGLGQFAIGTFAADSSGIATFSFSGNSNNNGTSTQVNALQFRDLGKAVPEVSTTLSLGLMLGLGGVLLCARKRIVRKSTGS